MKFMFPVVISLLLVAVASKAWSLTEASAVQVKPVTIIEDVSVASDALEKRESELDKLNEKRAELEELSEKIDLKKAKLEAYEKRLADELDTLKAATADLKKLRDSVVTFQSEELERLSQVYGNMKARDAAAVLNNMNPQDILKIVDGMSQMQATAILGAMEPKLAKDVTSMLLARSERFSR